MHARATVATVALVTLLLTACAGPASVGAAGIGERDAVWTLPPTDTVLGASGDTVVLVRDGQIIALSIASGATRWESGVALEDLPGTPETPRAVVTEAAITAASWEDGRSRVVNLDLATGAQRWSAHIDAAVGVGGAAEGVILLEPAFGTGLEPEMPTAMRALDASDGSERWRVEGLLGMRRSHWGEPPPPSSHYSTLERLPPVASGSHVLLAEAFGCTTLLVEAASGEVVRDLRVAAVAGDRTCEGADDAFIAGDDVVEVVRDPESVELVATPVHAGATARWSTRVEVGTAETLVYPLGDRIAIVSEQREPVTVDVAAGTATAHALRDGLLPISDALAPGMRWVPVGSSQGGAASVIDVTTGMVEALPGTEHTGVASSGWGDQQLLAWLYGCERSTCAGGVVLPLDRGAAAAFRAPRLGTLNMVEPLGDGILGVSLVYSRD